MSDRIQELLQRVAEASQSPNNSFHAHEISRHWGALNGLLAAEKGKTDELLADIEAAYPLADNPAPDKSQPPAAG